MRTNERQLKPKILSLIILTTLIMFSFSCTPVLIDESWSKMVTVSNDEFGKKEFFYNNRRDYAICVFDYPMSTKREFFVFSKTQNDVIYKKVLINGGVVRWYDNRLIEIKSFGNNPREEVESYFFNVKTKRIQTDEETKDL